MGSRRALHRGARRSHWAPYSFIEAFPSICFQMEDRGHKDADAKAGRLHYGVKFLGAERPWGELQGAERPYPHDRSPMGQISEGEVPVG